MLQALTLLAALATLGGLALVLRRLRRLNRAIRDMPRHSEREMLMLGRLLAETVRRRPRIAGLEEVEFKVFSEFGDDGIIQWLVHHLDLPHRCFIEFGVEDYRESNTRFLLMNDNWQGLVMDGSERHVRSILGSEYAPRHDLQAVAAFIDRDNINALIAAAGFERDVGLLHIDLDGNDYWIWEAIDVVFPVVVVVEYNAVLGAERAISVPYDPRFQRTLAHSSNLYFGASLQALRLLGERKGYAFVGCNQAGNNAYFVRRDHLNDSVRELPAHAGFVASCFRESRDGQGGHSLLRGDERLRAIRGMPVVNVATGAMETL